MALRPQPLHLHWFRLLSGKPGLFTVLLIVLTQAACHVVLGTRDAILPVRFLNLTAFTLVAVMAWGAVLVDAPSNTRIREVRLYLALGASLLLAGAGLGMPRHLGVTLPLFKYYHFVFLLGELLILWGVAKVPRTKVASGELADELLDLACIAGVTAAVLWGALDTKFEAFMANTGLVERLAITLHIVVPFAGTMLCYWAVVRREKEQVSILPGIWLLLAFLLLALRNMLLIGGMATESDVTTSIAVLSMGPVAMCFALALHAIMHGKSQEIQALNRYARIPRATVVLWLSLAWVAVALGLLLRQTLAPESLTHPAIVAIMGLGVLLLVAVRQGRNMTNLIRLRDELDASNKSLANSNQQLQALNKQIEVRAAREVDQLSARVEQLYEHTPWGIFFIRVDPAAGLVFETMNPALEQRYGNTRDKVTMDYIAERAGPEEGKKVMEALLHCAGTHETVELDSELLINGQVRHSHITLIPISDEHGSVVRIAGYLRDITPEYNALIALRESEDKFRKVFRSCPEGVVLTDFESGRILETNEQFMRLIGHNAEEIVGMPTTDLGLWDSREARATAMEILEKCGRVTEHEATLRGASGNRISCLFSAELVEMGGRRRVLSFFKDMTLHRLAEEARLEAVHREQRLQEEYTVKLIRAQEAERCRIAGDLHDGIGQEMLVIRNRLQMLSAQNALPDALRGEVSELCNYALNAVHEVRRLSHDLRPYQLDHLGLTAVLRSSAESIAKASSLKLDLHIDDIDDVLDADKATSLYRIVQESLNNVAKHAQASHLLVHVDRDLHDITVRVEDNGRGFDTQAQRNGLGMGNLNERTRMLKGTLTIAATPGSGTKMKLVVPIESELPPAPAKNGDTPEG